MMDYLWNYLEEQGQYGASVTEEQMMEHGMRLYLQENGIRENEERPYFRKYLQRNLSRIDRKDLKNYFMQYPLISEVKQLAIRKENGAGLSDEDVRRLRTLMTQLHRFGLGEKYIPDIQVDALLGY